LQDAAPKSTLLSQQVLLSLSPLHHCVLPAPETAALCPSSFRPAVGKLLQDKLLSRPVLDAFQHQHNGTSSRANMTHLWWHIGLRRWHLMQQIRRAAAPSTAPATWLITCCCSALERAAPAGVVSQP